jgi:hypothetical protein
MVLEQDNADRAVLALLSLAPPDNLGTPQEVDWDAIERIRKNDLLGEAESFGFTDEDLIEAESLLDQLFSSTSV